MVQTLYATRPSVVSGSFYSANKSELSSQVKRVLSEAKSFKDEDVRALIVPHAGYIYSADVAATAYKTMHKNYKNIFLIGSSHHISFNGASIYTQGDYATPLGEVSVNHNIVKALTNSSKYFTYNPNAHNKEHTLEVQLPFLQTIYGSELNIVPIIVATNELHTIQELAKSLKPFFNSENLFVISTDLSHYPNYEDAYDVDTLTLNAMASNSTQTFIDTLIKNESLELKDMLTSACGWSSVLLLQTLTQSSNYKYEILEYKNSGDSTYGDRDRVVGYGAIRVYKSSENFFLSENEKQELLELAKLSLYEATIHNKKIEVDESKIAPKLKEHLGAFVTLNKEHNLRGCIGTFEPHQPLYEVVINMAIAAAQNDHRFNKVSADELKDIELEISVLTPRKKINSIDEIVLGRDGIYIKKGSKNGTFLPHVATQMGWSVEEFVGYCAQEKAKIGFDGYKDAELFTYEAIVF
ncbi:MAG: AmmeMemoRadiSam system protein B [Campylobacterota bacterium]|nr:AmmeMemoRadiSam system protein B [Campylobacterota bacterium]